MQVTDMEKRNGPAPKYIVPFKLGVKPAMGRVIRKEANRSGLSYADVIRMALDDYFAVEVAEETERESERR